MWKKCSEDRLIRDVDLDWLTETAVLVGSPQTFLQCRALGWDSGRYEAWLAKTFMALAS